MAARRRTVAAVPGRVRNAAILKAVTAAEVQQRVTDMATDLVERKVPPPDARDRLFDRFKTPQLLLTAEQQTNGAYQPRADIPIQLIPEEDARVGRLTKLLYGFAIECRRDGCTNVVRNTSSTTIWIPGPADPPAVYYCSRRCQKVDEPRLKAVMPDLSRAALEQERKRNIGLLGTMVSMETAAHNYHDRQRRWEVEKAKAPEGPPREARFRIWSADQVGISLPRIAQAVLSSKTAQKNIRRLQVGMRDAAPEVFEAIARGTPPHSLASTAATMTAAQLNTLILAMRSKVYAVEARPGRTAVALLTTSPALTAAALQFLIVDPPTTAEDADHRHSTLIGPWGRNPELMHITTLELTALALITEAMPRLQPTRDVILKGFDPPGARPTKHLLWTNEAYYDAVEGLGEKLAEMNV